MFELVLWNLFDIENVLFLAQGRGELFILFFKLFTCRLTHLFKNCALPSFLLVLNIILFRSVWLGVAIARSQPWHKGVGRTMLYKRICTLTTGLCLRVILRCEKKRKSRGLFERLRKDIFLPRVHFCTVWKVTNGKRISTCFSHVLITTEMS